MKRKPINIDERDLETITAALWYYGRELEQTILNKEWGKDKEGEKMAKEELAHVSSMMEKIVNSTENPVVKSQVNEFRKGE